MPSAPLRFRHPFAFLVALLMLAPRPCVADVTGQWVSIGPGPGLYVYDVAQSGSSLTMYYGFPMSGSISPGGGFSVSFSEGGAAFGIGGLFLVDETYFAANTGAFFGGSFQFGTLVGLRCECADGNSVAGDGCDPRCQIEPCYTCAGTPSVCTPLADGATCNDRNACTVGETCSAGVCGGGSAVVPCVNLTGSWAVRQTSIQGPHQTSWRTSIRQLGTALEIGGAAGGLPGLIGEIDPVSRELDTWEPIAGFGCGLERRNGVAGADGNTYAASGDRRIPVSDYCEFDPVVVAAWRCGSGTVDPLEQCDDGNTVDGDGCSATCQSEFCASQANGTPCDDGDTCTAGDVCQGGLCVGSAAFGAPCDDGVACTSDDVCLGPGMCEGTPACGPCAVCSALNGCVPSNGASCDDGDQCTADTCQGGVCVGTPRPVGAGCDDGVACTSGDACDPAGSCHGSPGCGPCLECVDDTGCVAAPVPLCTPPARARLTLADGDPARAAVTLRWENISPALDFGAPDVSDDYALCLFDTSAAEPTLLFRAVAPAAATCGDGACWASYAGGGFGYRNALRTPDGLASLQLKQKATGGVSVIARGKGSLLASRPLGLPITPAPVPLTAQVVGEGGACVEAVFDAGAITRNVPGVLRARRP